jgi:glycosyltransferase 2 family protein
MFVVAVVASIGLAVVSEWDEVLVSVQQLTWWTLVLAFVAVVLGVMAGVEVWHSIVAALGSPLPYGAAAQIVMVGQLGKYIPGSVWAFVAQTELGRRANVPRARAFVGVLVATGISVVTAFLLAPLALPTVANPWVRAAMMVSPAALLALYPPLLSWVVRTALKLLRRPQPDLHISGRSILRATFFSLVTYAAFGTHLWLLARSVSDMGPARIVLCTAAMALAMTLGVFAFLAPSGLGVREAFVVAALVPVVPLGQALGISLVSRFLFVAADLTSASVALLAARGALREARRQATDPALEEAGQPPAPAAAALGPRGTKH